MADTVLLLEGDRRAAPLIRAALERGGAEVVCAAGDTGLARYERLQPDFVVLDLSDDASGPDLLERLVAHGAAVIVLAAPATSASVRALPIGALQLLLKPVDPDQVAAAADRVRESVRLRAENERLRARGRGQGGLEALGSSPPMRELAQRVERAAQDGREPLLLVGEVGTGKRWLARLVHELGPRRRGPFVEVVAAERAPATLEAELFGQEPTAEASGDEGRRRSGLLELAEPGSVFLREIGDLTQGLQVRFATLLETGTLRRAGGTREIAVDVRIMASTSQDPAVAARAGGPAAALYARLSAYVLRLPALRERDREDRLAIVDRLMVDLGNDLPGVPSECTPQAMDRLLSAPWPGNVRELRAVLERALWLARGAARLDVHHLPPDLSDGAALGADPVERSDRPIPLAAVEREYIERALRYHRGNRTRAAHDLGISRATLINKIKAYALDL